MLLRCDVTGIKRHQIVDIVHLTFLLYSKDAKIMKINKKVNDPDKVPG